MVVVDLGLEGFDGDQSPEDAPVSHTLTLEQRALRPTRSLLPSFSLSMTIAVHSLVGTLLKSSPP